MKLNKFNDFDTFCDNLLPSEKNICLMLRQLVQDNFPTLREKFAYGVPYYHQHSRICFIYPASFPYSGHNDGVAFGFARGHLLSNEQSLLEMGTRKEVGYVHLLTAKDFPEMQLLEMLHEALLLDEELYRAKGR